MTVAVPEPLLFGKIVRRRMGDLAEIEALFFALVGGSPGAEDVFLYPGGAHGFTLVPDDLSKLATARMDAFLNRVLG